MRVYIESNKAEYEVREYLVQSGGGNTKVKKIVRYKLESVGMLPMDLSKELFDEYIRKQIFKIV